LAGLTFGRLILWWYFIWYLVVLVRYFDPSARLWLTAVGLSLIIGTALLINTTASGSRRVHLETWPAVRLYLFPFCVSSFSSLVKGRDFILVFSPRWLDHVLALGLCGMFWLIVAMAKLGAGEPPVTEQPLEP
jgi:hypothetical protein